MSRTQATQHVASDVVGIPHNLLIRSSDNVRTVKPGKIADQQLIASIKAEGVLQNIVVKPSEAQPGFYEVAAGGRRLSAVAYLIKQGDFTDDYPMPAKIKIVGSSSATSLTENMMRKPMHPADEFAAFASMRKDGMNEAEIAEHFGLKVIQVAQRLRLADVHPQILNAYRKGHLNLETVMAFTLADTKSAQLTVFKELGHHCQPHRVRSLITKDGISSDSALAKYVTIAAYKAAGGSVVADMFDERSYLSDAELLQELATAKLTKSAKRLQKKEGWQNVEVITDRNQRIHQYHRLEPQPVGVPKALSEALKVGIETHTAMEDSDADWTEEREAEFDELCGEIEKIEAKVDRYRQYSDDDKAKARCFVSVGHNGKVVIDRGMVTPQQRAAKSATQGGDSAADPVATLPNALVADLGLQRQHIAKAALVKDTQLASDVLLYTLCCDVLELDCWNARAIDARFSSVMPDQPEVSESKAATALSAERDKLTTAWLTADSVAARFDALRKLTPKVKQTLLAYCVAECFTVDLAKEGDDDIGEAVLSDLSPDYAKTWRPSGENYFRRLRIPALLAQGAELFGDDWKELHSGNKKKDLVAWFDAFFNGKAPADLSPEHREIRDHWLPSGFETFTGEPSQS